MSETPRPRTVLDKNDVLTGLFNSWDSIEALLAGLTDEQWEQPTSLPGWTVHDVVAHIVGTETMLSGAPMPESGGSRPDHVHNDIGALNEAWVESLRAESPASMMAKFREITTRRKAALSAMTPEEWNTVTLTPVGPDSYGRFMRVRTFDCWMHEHDIRDAVGRNAADDELAGPDARLALDEMSSSMGFGENYTVGEEVVVRVARREGEAALEGPTGTTLVFPQLVGHGQGYRIDPPAVPGVYFLTGDRETLSVFAVNVDAAESDLSKISTGDMASDLEGLDVSRIRGVEDIGESISVLRRGRELSHTFIWLALILLLAETVIASSLLYRFRGANDNDAFEHLGKTQA